MNNSFFKTKSGRLTIAFIVIMFAFMSIMIGLNSDNSALSSFGFILMLAAMLYSPFKEFIIDKAKK